MVPNNSGKCEDFDGEEVDSGQNLPMCVQKGLPRHSPRSFRRRFDAMVIENALHGVSVRRDPEIVQGVPDPSVSPRLILVRYVYDKIGNSISYPWSSWLRAPEPRLADPSYFLATSVLNQRRRVSGVTIPTNCSKVFRPNALAVTLSLRLCSSVNRRRRPSKCSRYTRTSSMR